ncbi:MAG: S41 family peptidase [bacterium]
MFKNKKAFFLVIFLLIIVFGGGFWLGRNQVQCQFCPAEEVNFSLFWEAWNKLKLNYVNPEEINTQKMLYGAISGMVDSLDDPYTLFFSPEESKKFLEDSLGRFEGVGMEVGMREGILQVIAPLNGTPAEKAGLRPGDKIIKINDTATSDITIDEAVNLIRGPKGTVVILTIFRDEWESTKEITLTRDVIEPTVVEWELKDLNDGRKIAYIKLYQFSETADIVFAQEVSEIVNSEATGIILDLRNNPGGYLEVANDIAGFFLKRGDVIVIEDRGQDKEPKEYKATGNEMLLKYPTVVLINQGSASGSEILAGALRDDRGIQLVGETSFGKGSVQQLVNLSNNSSLKVTIAKWLTPNGTSISKVGLDPDVEIEITEDDFKADQDPQLDRAIEILKGLK